MTEATREMATLARRILYPDGGGPSGSDGFAELEAAEELIKAALTATADEARRDERERILDVLSGFDWQGDVDLVGLYAAIRSGESEGGGR